MNIAVALGRNGQRSIDGIRNLTGEVFILRQPVERKFPFTDFPPVHLHVSPVYMMNKVVAPMRYGNFYLDNFPYFCLLRSIDCRRSLVGKCRSIE